MAAKQASTKPAEPTVAQLIDELGQVEHALEPYRILIAKEEKLRTAIRERFEEAPAGEPVEAHGASYTAALGPKAIVKTIDNKAAFKLLGQGTFVRIAKLTLAAIEREQITRVGLEAFELRKFVSEARTGARSLRIFRRAAAADVKEAA